MKVVTSPRDYGLEFNITPLIDVVFLLNIFFLVATYFIQHEQVEPVQLPGASQGQEDRETSARLVVTISADGLMTMASQPVSLQEIESRLHAAQIQHPQSAELRLRCDRQVAFQEVEPLLLMAAKAGIRRIRFNVLSQ